MPLHPGKILQDMLKERGWTQDELAVITGYSRTTINELISGKNGVTNPELAIALAAAFGNSPLDWMHWDSAYRLSQVLERPAQVHTSARLYDIAPIRDMQKRGWIAETKDVRKLEQELKAFFGVNSLESPPVFPVAFRRSVESADLGASERAWMFRARQMASALVGIGRFDSEKMGNCTKELRDLAAYSKESRHIAPLLARYGVRFLVVEQLPGTRIDGATFWLNDSTPVIVMSARIDRIDNFWFTLMHECSHVANGDALSLDSDLFADHTAKPPQGSLDVDIEARANEDAADYLIPKNEIESFIRRVSPLYSKERIIQFAHRIKLHPGIIVGQLQKRDEIGYSANREMLVKVRASVIETALTDGWGRTITAVGM